MDGCQFRKNGWKASGRDYETCTNRLKPRNGHFMPIPGNQRSPRIRLHIPPKAPCPGILAPSLRRKNSWWQVLQVDSLNLRLRLRPLPTMPLDNCSNSTHNARHTARNRNQTDIADRTLGRTGPLLRLEADTYPGTPLEFAPRSLKSSNCALLPLQQLLLQGLTHGHTAVVNTQTVPLG